MVDIEIDSQAMMSDRDTVMLHRTNLIRKIDGLILVMQRGQPTKLFMAYKPEKVHLKATEIKAEPVKKELIATISEMISKVLK